MKALLARILQSRQGGTLLLAATYVSREAVAAWRELVAADVDAINTDDLAGLQRFLLAEDPQEAQNHD